MLTLPFSSAQTALLSSHRKNHWLRQTLMALNCTSLGRGDTGKVKLFLIPTLIASGVEFVCSLLCWNFSSGNKFLSAPSSMRDAQVIVLQVLPDHGRGGWNWFMAHGLLQGTQLELRSMCLLSDVQMGKTPPSSSSIGSLQLLQRHFCS